MLESSLKFYILFKEIEHSGLLLVYKGQVANSVLSVKMTLHCIPAYLKADNNRLGPSFLWLHAAVLLLTSVNQISPQDPSTAG